MKHEGKSSAHLKHSVCVTSVQQITSLHDVIFAPFNWRRIYAVFWDVSLMCSYHTHADLWNRITLAFKNMYVIISCLFSNRYYDIFLHFYISNGFNSFMFPSQYKQHRNNLVVHSIRTHIEIIAKVQKIAIIFIYIQNYFLWCS